MFNVYKYKHYYSNFTCYTHIPIIIQYNNHKPFLVLPNYIHDN